MRKPVKFIERRLPTFHKGNWKKHKRKLTHKEKKDELSRDMGRSLS